MEKEKQEKKEKQAEQGKQEEKERSLEETFGDLDEIILSLEDPEISLEESFSMYQKGMELLKSCNEKIDTVEKKILMMNGDGGLDEF